MAADGQRSDLPGRQGAGVAGAPAACWCGNRDLQPFGAGYWHCAVCETLVRPSPFGGGAARVGADDEGFYGREYWQSYQSETLQHPTIHTRVRTDLADRCLFWLRTLLRYRVPPGRTLELGCAHGGLVALMRQAGFDASGLELSPWVAAFAREAFGIPVWQGPVETQPIEPGSLDAIVMMDVLEHLEDPVTTMRRSFDLLKPDGIVLVQTPRYRERTTFDELENGADPFLLLLKPVDHLFLFSGPAVEEFFRRFDARVRFEPAIFAHYDMFLVAGRGALEPFDPDVVSSALSRTPGGRLVQAMLDLYQRSSETEAALTGERDALAAQLEAHSTALGKVREERDALREYLASATRDLERVAQRERAWEDQVRTMQDSLAAKDRGLAERVRELAERATQIAHLGSHLDRLEARIRVLQSVVDETATRSARASMIVDRIRRTLLYRTLSLAGPGARFARQLAEVFPSTATGVGTSGLQQSGSPIDSKGPAGRPSPGVAADGSATRGATRFGDRLADADGVFRDGIHGVLPDGWTEDLLVVTYGKSDEARTLDVTFEAPSWGFGRAMLVSVEGPAVPIDWFDIERGAQRAISVPLLPSGGYVEFGVTPLSQPKAFGMGEDERFLGCRLVAWRVAPSAGTGIGS